MESKTKGARPRLQRSERVFSESHLTSWEVFVRDSLLTLAWPDLLNVVSGNPDSYLESNARLVLSLLPLPVTAEEVHELGIGIEIYLSNKKSALTFGNLDKPEFEPTKGILKSTSYTFFTLSWDRGFITLGEVNQTKPIFTQEIKTKKTLMALRKNQFHFYAVQGSNILWSFPFCDEDEECDVHTTGSMQFQQFWPLRETETGHDLVFHVRAFHSAYILLVPSPILDYPNLKIALAKSDNYSRITCTEYEKGPTITLKEAIFPKLLSYWKWGTFSVSLFADTLQFHWTKDVGVFLIMEAKFDMIRSLKWFSPASENNMAHWAFFCTPPLFASPPQAFLPECALTNKETNYVGSQSVTSTGLPCLPWSGRKLIPSSVLEQFKDRENDLLGMYNYCRDPKEAQEGTYCYAISEGASKRIDKHFCRIRKCKSAECRMAGTGNDYVGKVNHTRSNRTCQYWIADVPIKLVKEVYDHRKKLHPSEDVEEDLLIPTIAANDLSTLPYPESTETTKASQIDKSYASKIIQDQATTKLYLFTTPKLSHQANYKSNVSNFIDKNRATTNLFLFTTPKLSHQANYKSNVSNFNDKSLNCSTMDDKYSKFTKFTPYHISTTPTKKHSSNETGNIKADTQSKKVNYFREHVEKTTTCKYKFTSRATTPKSICTTKTNFVKTTKPRRKRYVDDLDNMSADILKAVPQVQNISGAIKDYFNHTQDKNVKLVKVHNVEIGLLNGTLYADMSPERAENYCRNPSRSLAGSWCYTMDQNVIREPCDVPDCDREEVCTVFITGNGTGRDVFILPQWKERGIHGGLYFSTKQWNPDLVDGIVFEIRSFNPRPKMKLIIGAEFNDKIILYKDDVMLKEKSFPHLIPAGKWVSLWLQMRQGELLLGFEGVSDALFEWIADNSTQELNPIFVNFRSNNGNTLGLFFKCEECHAENTTSSKYSKVMPINIWTGNEDVVFHNLTLQIRAVASFRINLMTLPGGDDFYIIHVSESAHKVEIQKNLKRFSMTLHSVVTEAPVVTQDSWTTLNISFGENTLVMTSNSTKILTYNSTIPLLFYYFSVISGNDGWVTWMANCEPLDIDGPPKDGGWSKWSPFVCTVTCGGGEGYRTRTCSNPRPNIFGQLCHGPTSSTGACNEFECGDLSPETFETIRHHLQKTNYSIVIEEGKSVRLYNDVDILSRISGESPDAYFDWTLNGRFLEPIVEKIDFVGDDIVIKNVSDADSGVYICMLYRINKQRLVIHAISVAVIPKKYSITTRATLPIDLLCKSLSLAYVYSDLAQKWLLNDTLFLDYGITMLAAVSNEHIAATNMSLNGLWKCIVHQDDLKLTWVTNIVKVRVKTAPNFYTHLMEDPFTKPIFGKLKTEAAVIVVIVLIVLLVFGLAAGGLYVYLKYGRLPEQFKKKPKRKRKSRRNRL